jgi:hypothetical protein
MNVSINFHLQWFNLPPKPNAIPYGRKYVYYSYRHLPVFTKSVIENKEEAIVHTWIADVQYKQEVWLVSGTVLEVQAESFIMVLAVCTRHF